MSQEILFIHKPWGNFKQYTHNQLSTVKILTVNPNVRLSLQSHTKREELWIILDEGVSVEIDGNITTPKLAEEVLVPLGAKHRLIGAPDKTCRVLEISFGQFDEEDIIRYEDDFGRAG